MARVADTFLESARELERVFHPEKTVHLAIDWQALYCDKKFPTNHGNGPQLNKRIKDTLRQVTAFKEATQGQIPTWHIYHDPALTPEDFPKNFFHDMKRLAIENRIEEFRLAAQKLCLPVHKNDVTFRKPYKNAFLGTDLAEKLSRKGIFTLLVTGIFRNTCVAETIQDAAARFKFNTFVIEDLTVSQDKVTSVAEAECARVATLYNIHRVDAARVKKVLGL